MHMKLDDATEWGKEMGIVVALNAAVPISWIPSVR